MDIHQIVRELVEGVGSTVVQSLAGVKDRGAPSSWAKPEGPEPRLEAQQRLRLAHRVWRTLRQAEGPSVAAAWLVGSNPRLREVTPVTAIRDLRAEDVLGAAEAFVNDVAE